MKNKNIYILLFTISICIVTYIFYKNTRNEGSVLQIQSIKSENGKIIGYCNIIPKGFEWNDSTIAIIFNNKPKNSVFWLKNNSLKAGKNYLYTIEEPETNLLPIDITVIDYSLYDKKLTILRNPKFYKHYIVLSQEGSQTDYTITGPDKFSENYSSLDIEKGSFFIDISDWSSGSYNLEMSSCNISGKFIFEIK